MYQRCVVIVLEGADADALDEVAEKMEDHFTSLAKDTVLPEGIKIGEVYSMDPDAPEDEEDDGEENGLAGAGDPGTEE